MKRDAEDFRRVLLDRAGGAYSAREWAEIMGDDSRPGFSLPTGTGDIFPKLQITPTGRRVHGLDRFLDAFTLHDPWMKLVILLEPSPRLGGRTPLEALRDGDVEDAAAVANAYGSHGA
jgi:hypothetical protein